MRDAAGLPASMRLTPPGAKSEGVGPLDRISCHLENFFVA